MHSMDSISHTGTHALGNGGPDLIIFDCDGVLVDSERITARVFADMLANSDSRSPCRTSSISSSASPWTNASKSFPDHSDGKCRRDSPWSIERGPAWRC